jgi:hypothetical protein
MSAGTTKTAAAKKAATKKAPAQKPAATKTPITIEQVLDRLSTASKEFVDEVEKQVRTLEDRVADLRDRGENTTEHWAELIEARVRAIRTDLDRVARRVTAVRVAPATKAPAKKPAATKAAATKPAATKAAAKKAPAKKPA